jgi:hypothetical protein
MTIIPKIGKFDRTTGTVMLTATVPGYGEPVKISCGVSVELVEDKTALRQYCTQFYNRVLEEAQK